MKTNPFEHGAASEEVISMMCSYGCTGDTVGLSLIHGNKRFKFAPQISARTNSNQYIPEPWH